MFCKEIKKRSLFQNSKPENYILFFVVLFFLFFLIKITSIFKLKKKIHYFFSLILNSRHIHSKNLLTILLFVNKLKKYDSIFMQI